VSVFYSAMTTVLETTVLVSSETSPYKIIAAAGH
jgi:hypothetical protein